MATPKSGAAADSEQFGKVVEIISRYPAVDEVDRGLIIDYLHTSPEPEQAVLRSRGNIQTQLIAFEADHQRQLASADLSDPAPAHAPGWFRVAVWTGIGIAALILALFVSSEG